MMLETKVLGRKTTVLTVDTWKGRMIEVRQSDVLSGLSQVFLDKETILKLAEMIKGDGNNE